MFFFMISIILGRKICRGAFNSHHKQSRFNKLAAELEKRCAFTHHCTLKPHSTLDEYQVNENNVKPYSHTNYLQPKPCSSFTISTSSATRMVISNTLSLLLVTPITHSSLYIYIPKNKKLAVEIVKKRRLKPSGFRYEYQQPQDQC